MHEISDKKLLRRFFARDPDLHLYCIGDLDDFFFPHTRWFAREENGAIEAIFLVYTASELPVLIALEEHNVKASEALLRELLPTLPPRLYVHLSPGLARIMDEFYELEPHGTYQRMKLATNAYASVKEDPRFHGRRLTPSDLPAALRLFEESYPENWFDPRMLETGKYQGLFDDGKLVALAGVHVYSREFKVAALGNITTHPAYRNAGLGAVVTARLCRDLEGDSEHVGLNAAVDNLPAQRCYAKLGFVPHARYEEYLGRKRS